MISQRRPQEQTALRPEDSACLLKVKTGILHMLQNLRRKHEIERGRPGHGQNRRGRRDRASPLSINSGSNSR